MARLETGIVLTAILLMSGLSPVIAAIKDPVRTESGLLSGVPGKDPSVAVYKGVPFAAPPVNELRWKPPQPPIPWQGVLQADHFGSICPQRRRPNPSPGAASEESMSEDCLFLNVWTGAASATEHRPVIVWLFGGGYSGGYGSDPHFDGEGLARKGLVVVTFNIRLGILGFLATPELSKESGHHVSGNYGMLDKIACLQWVKKNIAAFGGDPGRVTLMGQSSGGESVILLNGSPLAKGLYQRALAESGARSPHDPDYHGHPVYWQSVKEAETAGVRITEMLGAHSLKELRAIPWEKLLQWDPEKAGGVSLTQFRPYFDGWVFPQGFNETYAKGLQNDVPFMTGFNRDELVGTERMPDPKLGEYLASRRNKYGVMADELFKLYPAASDQEAFIAHHAANRDNLRVSTFLLATAWKKKAKSPVYTYMWTHAPPVPDRDKRGADHGSEISYLFDNFYTRNLPWTDEDRKIADIMSTYLVNFSSTGNPNSKNVPVWPEFDPKSRTTMELGDHFVPIPVADSDKFDFMMRFFLSQKPM
jgi:para-nitrobenzyl esterase